MHFFLIKLPTFRVEMKAIKRKSECVSEDSVSHAKREKADKRFIEKTTSKNGDWGNLPSTVILIIAKLDSQE